LRRDSPCDKAAGNFGGRLRHRFAGQYFVERLGQVAPRWGGSLEVDAKLIIDATLIENLPLGTEHERFRGALGPKLIGDDVAGILEDRERDTMLLGVRRDAGWRILAIGIDGE